MSLFRRRKETLNERLLREAGLEPATVDARHHESTVADPLLRDRLLREAHMVAEAGAPIIGAPSVDTLVTVEASEIDGQRVEFVALPDGSLLIDDAQGDANLGALADAVEAKLQPPYRARGVRQSGSTWNVAANRIQVVQMDADGDEIDLTMNQGERELRVDGRRSNRGLPGLERLAERASRDYVVHAERLDGDLWEVRVSAL